MSELQEQKAKLSPAAITAIILFILCGISLYIRIALPYDQVIVNGSVWFKGTDAWYHMRLVDNLLYHFPLRMSFDPFTFYPHGVTVPWPPFFDWLIASIAWLVGLGSPDPHTVDIIGAYLPPILGTLTIIPVYFIGRELFNRWVGWLAALLVVILPGEFLNRSLLGFTDHHVAESLFVTTTILFLILAVKKAGEREITFSHLVNKDWAILTKPIIYILLAGIFFGIYLLTWVGGLLLVFTISAWLIIQFILDQLRGKSTDHLCIIGTLTFLIASIMFLPFASEGKLETIGRISLIIATIIPLILSGISRLMTSRAIKPAYYPLALLGFAGIGFAIFYAIDVSLVKYMLGQFRVFTPSGAGLTILEMHPLLMPHGNFSFQVAWLNFTTSFFICFISLAWLIYANIKKESTDKTLFLIWSVIMLMAVLGQRRFSYYFAINASLLTGYFSWRVLEAAGLSKLATKTVEAAHKFKKRSKTEARAKRRTFLQPRATWRKVILAGMALFFIVIFPCIGLPGIKPYAKVLGLHIKITQSLAQGKPLITEGWHSSLEWLRHNSPEPFEDPNYYYELYPPKHEFKYPETAYSVMSWWDYGHWITRIGHRIPISNPFQQGATGAARYFTAQDVSSANEMMDKWGVRYVIIDKLMPTSKFYAMPQWAGSSKDDFYETYYQSKDGKLQSITLFYPSYYESMVVRLYNFNGEAVVPEKSLVISYEEAMTTEGVRLKKIIEAKTFPTYKDAQDYISRQESGNYKIVGPNPNASIVPLGKMEHYKLVHSSAKPSADGLPEIKIFEYSK